MTSKQLHQLNLFLAEKVMGWLRTCDTRLRKDRFYIDPNGRIVCAIYDGEWAYWQPTIDPGQAMMVLEKCLWVLGPVGLQMRQSPDNEIMARSKKGLWCHTGTSKSLPEAICLFAKEVFA